MEKKRFLIEGRVVPERVNVILGPIRAKFVDENSQEIQIISNVLLSKLTCVIESDKELHKNTLRDIALQVVSTPINTYGFLKHHALDIVIDSCVAIHEFNHVVYGVNGGAFDVPPFYPGMTFVPYGDEAEFPLPDTHLISNQYFQRAIYELNAALKTPQLTTLHCKLAIEAVRNAFDAPTEKKQWELMREQLRVTELRMRELDKKSGQLRHGKSVQYEQGERERDLQIAWEIVHRYMLWMQDRRPLLNVDMF